MGKENFLARSLADNVVADLQAQVRRTHEQRINKISQAILGVHFDSWGRVERVDTSIVNSVLGNEGVQKAKEEFVRILAKQIEEKPLTTKDQQRVVRLIRNKIIEELVDRIYDELSDKIYEHMKDLLEKDVIKRLAKDPEVAPLLVGYELKKANENK